MCLSVSNFRAQHPQCIWNNFYRSVSLEIYESQVRSSVEPTRHVLHAVLRETKIELNLILLTFKKEEHANKNTFLDRILTLNTNKIQKIIFMLI